MKRLFIFILIFVSVFKGVSQENEDDYSYDEETLIFITILVLPMMSILTL